MKNNPPKLPNPNIKKPPGCGVMGQDLECPICGKKVYGINLADICPYELGSNKESPNIFSKPAHKESG